MILSQTPFHEKDRNVNGTKIHSVMRSTGSYVPTRVVANQDFLATLDTSDEWIRTRTGIRERRYVADDESSATMAIEAGRLALARANLPAVELDLIVCATVTPDFMSPSCANLIQHGLGCRTIPSFDVAAGCTGFLYALSVADQFVQTGSARNVLVVGADVLTRIIDHSDRNTCILFGDGAGAVLFRGERDADRGLHSIRLFSDAGGGHLIRVPSKATQPLPGEHLVKYLEMNGREVYKFAVSRMIELIEQARIEAASQGRQVDLLVPHQVNKRIIDAALEATGFPREKVMVNLDRYGNTSAASIPIALDEAILEGKAKEGDTLLLVAFGAGLTWGSLMLTL
jgi:3-oxoacyl-[acyl-carrier-protein] synthase-3